MNVQNDDSTFWSVISDVLRYLVETEVPLAVVLVLLLIGGIRELLAAWAKRRMTKNDV